MREDQHTFFAIWQQLTSVRVHHLWIKVILPDMAPCTRLNALLRDTGTDNFTKSVNIRRLDTKCSFDIRPNGIRPGFSTQEAILEADLFRSNATTFEFLTQCLGIRRCAADDLGLEVEDQG